MQRMPIRLRPEILIQIGIRERHVGFLATENDIERVAVVSNATFGRRHRTIKTANAIKPVQYHRVLMVRQKIIQGRRTAPGTT